MRAGVSAASSTQSTCAICGAKVVETVARPASSYAPRGAYSIGTCPACGCGQTLPIPSQADLAALYAREYNYDAHVLIAPEKRWRAGRILDAALGNERGGRLLDVGCMYGYLLEQAKERGVTAAVGVELSPGPAKVARERGLDVFCGTIETFAEKRPEPFDLIVVQHVLEHVAELTSFLETTKKLIAPGGRLCICVPNFDARARRLFSDAWAWYQTPVHLHHFGLAAMTKLLDDNGFEITRHEAHGGDSLFVLLTLLQSIGRAPSSDVASPGVIGRSLLRTASALLRPYYYVGDDELLVIARARHDR